MYTDSNTQELQSRTAQFQQGIAGSGEVASSLQAASDRFNSQVGPFSPNSVLDAYQHPGFHPNNGNSATDASRQTPAGQLPAMNGISSTTYDALTPSYRTRVAP